MLSLGNTHPARKFLCEWKDYDQPANHDHIQTSRLCVEIIELKHLHVGPAASDYTPP
jgi:hypothetical protein